MRYPESTTRAAVPHDPATSAHPADVTAHLTPAAWEAVNRHLVRKAIAEFSHELLLVPLPLGPATRPGWQRWSLAADEGTQAHYAFDAQRMALRHWRIDAASIVRHVDGVAQPLDALGFVLEFRRMLRIRPDMLPVYLEEIASTLYGAAYKRAKPNPSSGELADADHQTVEQSMTEGHPAFVANNGRLGFDAADYLAYAPETGATLRLVWLAVRRELATFSSVHGLGHADLLRQELGAAQHDRLLAALRAQGVAEADYLLMPAHPWQWMEKLSIAFAAHVAQRDIVCLGLGDERYQVQQSIRTCCNVDAPARHFVKTSLSILNMGFMRGLSPYYMQGTPAICEFIHAIVDHDTTLRAHGFSILREVAAIGFRHRHFETGAPADSAYRKMLSCLWRESAVPRLRPGEQLMTMAALLHVDRDGQALLPVLVEKSGLDVRAWLRRYLLAYLAPLLHCYYAHDLVFMPHGENVMLVLQDHAPVRVIMKDIAEECSILNKDAALPREVQRLAVDVPEDVKLLAIFIDVFDGYFRFLAELLVDTGLCDEDTFWGLVADCAAHYQATHPHLQPRFERYDLYAPQFLHSCLNRLQLVNNRQMVNLADPAESFQTAGMLPNPIAKFRPPPAG
jgi:siderophore synthetase component